jgi:pimeloyl-ACP methyl ester carboxylesterase
MALVAGSCGVAPRAAIAPQASSPLAARSISTADMLTQAFQRADLDGDGALTIDETGLSPDQFKVFDQNGDSKITRDEFLRPTSLAGALKFLPLFKDLIAYELKQLHPTGGNTVSRTDVQQAFGGSPSDSANQVLATFDAADRGHKGHLTADEFQDFYLKLGTDHAGDGGLFDSPLAAWLLGAYLRIGGTIEAKEAVHPFPKRRVDKTPADLHIPFTNVAFQTQDGLTIRGWWIPAANPTQKTIILAHGWWDTKSRWVKTGEVGWLHPQFNQLVIDLRNNGDSDGTVTTFDYYEHLDVLAAVQYLKSQGYTDIGAMGNSMGAATVIRAASETRDIKAVWDDCSFGKVESAWTGFAYMDTHLPGCPLIAGAALAIAQDWLGGVDMATTEPVRLIAGVSPTPLQIVHGGNDGHVPPINSQWNFAAAGNPKSIWIVPGAPHGQSDQVAPQEYQQRLVAFFSQNL